MALENRYIHNSISESQTKLLKRAVEAKTASFVQIMRKGGFGRNSFIKGVIENRWYNNVSIYEMIEEYEKGNIQEYLAKLLRSNTRITMEEQMKIATGEVQSMSPEKIVLKTVDMESAFEIGAVMRHELERERVAVGDVIKVYKDCGLIAKLSSSALNNCGIANNVTLNNSSTCNNNFTMNNNSTLNNNNSTLNNNNNTLNNNITCNNNSTCNNNITLNNGSIEGEIIKMEDVVSILTLDQLDLINDPGNYDEINYGGEVSLYKSYFVAKDVQNKVDSKVRELCRGSKAELERGILVVKDLDFLKEDAALYPVALKTLRHLVQFKNSELCPHVILCGEIKECEITGVEDIKNSFIKIVLEKHSDEELLEILKMKLGEEGSSDLLKYLCETVKNKGIYYVINMIEGSREKGLTMENIKHMMKLFK
ncbi:RuvB-like protein 2 [Enteropsectra breve]|nr:RuvB-like protein 2 [Enteropsectra breve]